MRSGKERSHLIKTIIFIIAQKKLFFCIFVRE